ncbi:MAG: TonB family protein [Pseudomonadota bacterium]
MSANQSIAATLPAFDSNVADRRRTDDRLVSTLFLAVLLHSILIMGITFKAFSGPAAASPTLEVVMLKSEPSELTINDDAPYLAAHSQYGSGTTQESVRATTELPSEGTIANPGDATGNSPFAATPGDITKTPDIMASRSPSTFATPLQLETTTNPEQVAMRARLSTPAAPDALMVGDAVGENRAQGDDRRVAEISVSTREAVFAGYLSGWKGKIEKMGTLNFPDTMQRRGKSGNPILEVAINANGSLEDIVVRRSSNHPELDQAALRILRLASPFDPFPHEIAKDYDVLRFVYEWRFVDGAPVAASRLTATGESG